MVVNEISKKEKFWRKNYTADLSCEFTKVRKMIVRLPVTLNIHTV